MNRERAFQTGSPGGPYWAQARGLNRAEPSADIERVAEEPHATGDWGLGLSASGRPDQRFDAIDLRGDSRGENPASICRDQYVVLYSDADTP